MSYASLDDLIDRAGRDEIVQVADRDDDLVPDAAVVAAALEHADNIINGYVGARYGLPLSPVPPIVNTWAVAIARHHLHREAPPDYVEADRKEAIAALKDVARGLIALPVADGSVPAVETGQSVSASPAPVFTPDFLRGWR